MKQFTKRAGKLKEADFNMIKRLLDLGVKAKDVAEVSGWAYVTILRVKNIPNWETYKEYKVSYRRVVKERKVKKEEKEQVSDDTAIALITQQKYDGLLETMEKMTTTLESLAELEREEAEMIKRIHNFFVAASRAGKVKKFFGI